MRQIHGPFAAGEEILSSAISFSHLGIETHPNTLVNIDGEEIQICCRGILELENCSISSIYFPKSIDYAIITFT